MATDGSGHLTRLEWFGDDDFTAALARLDELGAAEQPADPRHSRAENWASQRLAEIVDLAHARDRAASRALLTDDFVRLDRRRGVAAPDAHGSDEWVAALDAWFDVGMERLSVEPLAVRGERLVLARIQLSNAEGAVVPFLGVWETDSSGRFVRAVHLDDDAFADAVAELDARYRAGEGAQHAAMLDAGTRTLASLQAEDWAGLAALLSDDFTLLDNRQLSNPALDRDPVRRDRSMLRPASSATLGDATRSTLLQGRIALDLRRGLAPMPRAGTFEWILPSHS